MEDRFQGISNAVRGHVNKTGQNWTDLRSCIVFGLSLLDRTNISAAYIAGLAQDLDLAVGARYNIALLIFFIGYALFELPSNYVIRRIGARWWLSFLIVSWGFMVFAMGFIHDWRILTVLRAFLGVFEAGL